jgi:DNA-binding winged helix-turn-helix (wHTH) protein
MAQCEHCAAELAGSLPALDPELFDADMRAVIRSDGSRFRLTRGQWLILEILWRRRARFVSIDSLCTLLDLRLNRPDACTTNGSLRVRITGLRVALVGSPWVIVTRPNTGYRLRRFSEIDPDATFYRRTVVEHEFPSQRLRARGLAMAIARK